MAARRSSCRAGVLAGGRSLDRGHGTCGGRALFLPGRAMLPCRCRCCRSSGRNVPAGPWFVDGLLGRRRGRLSCCAVLSAFRMNRSLACDGRLSLRGRGCRGCALHRPLRKSGIRRPGLHRLSACRSRCGGSVLDACRWFLRGSRRCVLGRLPHSDPGSLRSLCCAGDRPPLYLLRIHLGHAGGRWCCRCSCRTVLHCRGRSGGCRLNRGCSAVSHLRYYGCTCHSGHPCRRCSTRFSCRAGSACNRLGAGGRCCCRGFHMSGRASGTGRNRTLSVLRSRTGRLPVLGAALICGACGIFLRGYLLTASLRGAALIRRTLLSGRLLRATLLRIVLLR